MKLKKPLPKWAPLAGIVVAGLLVAVVGWKVVVSPQNTKAADLEAQTADVKQKISEQLAAVAASKTAAATPTETIRVADVYKLVKAMPNTDDIPDLLIELSQITKQAGVKVDSLSPTAGSTAGDGVPVALNVTGDFYSVTDLLYRLRNLVFVRKGSLEANGRLFTIDSVNLGSSGKDVTAAITLHAATYAPPAAATPTVPAVTPTSTDTTATTTTPAGGPSATGAP